jgi:CelD/BcsL family acetyltransferase involved in cellulose biosynthesis
VQAKILEFEEFLDSQQLWEDALKRSLDNNIFLTWDWLSTWLKHYGDKRRSLFITVIEDNKMIAAAPMMYTAYNKFGLRLRKIECLTNPAADYHTFLLTEKKTECLRMILDYAKKETPDWDLFELSEVPQNSETATVLASLEPKLAFKHRVQNRCPYTTLPTRFEDYFLALGHNLRRNLRKSENRAKKQYKVNFRLSSSKDEIKKDMEAFFDLHQKRWQSKSEAGAFADQKFRDFHLEIATRFAKRGWLALNLVTLNDVPASAGYAFVYGKKLYSYLSGFNPDFSEYRLGSLRLMYLIKHCIMNGLTEYDFMRGDEPYKEQWATSTRNNLEFWIMKKSIVPALYCAITKNERMFNLALKFSKY